MKKNILNKKNCGTLPIYYNLKQIAQITGLHYQVVRARNKKLKNGKYQKSDLIVKIRGTYRVDYSIVDEYMPKRKNKNRKTQPLINFEIKSFTTINPSSKYKSRAIFDDFMGRLKKEFPENNFIYGVEDDDHTKGSNMHIHIGTDLENLNLNRIYNLVDTYFGVYINDPKSRIMVKCETDVPTYKTYKYIIKKDLFSGRQMIRRGEKQVHEKSLCPF